MAKYFDLQHWERPRGKYSMQTKRKVIPKLFDVGSGKVEDFFNWQYIHSFYLPMFENLVINLNKRGLCIVTITVKLRLGALK